MRKVLQIASLPGYEPEIGCWMSALEQVRHRTIALVQGLSQETLDWRGPDGNENSIGSLLYHIALVEVSWLYYDLLLQEFPSSLEKEFPHPMAIDGVVTPLSKVPLSEHLSRLARSRAIFLDAFKEMSSEDWQTLRSPPEDDYDVSPAWAVFHLIEHEAGHGGQISSLAKRAGRARGG